jgi:hypothetical protein
LSFTKANNVPDDKLKALVCFVPFLLNQNNIDINRLNRATGAEIDNGILPGFRPGPGFEH